MRPTSIFWFKSSDPCTKTSISNSIKMDVIWLQIIQFIRIVCSKLYIFLINCTNLFWHKHLEHKFDGIKSLRNKLSCSYESGFFFIFIKGYLNLLLFLSYFYQSNNIGFCHSPVKSDHFPYLVQCISFLVIKPILQKKKE